jgi:acetate---CoA ligase (ADP-forming)
LRPVDVLEEMFDLDALEQVVLRVAVILEDIHEIGKFDLNPVIVLPEGQGVAIVDARIRVAETLLSLPFSAKTR